jgi:hypothetical protein
MEQPLPEAPWRVCPSGYKWVESRSSLFIADTEGWVLRPLEPYEGGDRIVRGLLELPSSLYREFANLQPTREAIKTFANTHGLLGISLIKKPKESHPNPRAEIVIDESFETWQNQILLMYAVITVWEAIQDENITTLARYSKVFQAYHELKGMTPINAAYHFVLNRVNEQFEPEYIEYWKPAPQAVLRRVAETLTNRFGTDFQVVPTTLHQALWCQVASWIKGGKPLQECIECKKLFVVNAKSPRSTLEFCSDACRVKAYRKRQEHARQLWAKGIPLATIAEMVGSDLAAVTRWITGHKEE